MLRPGPTPTNAYWLLMFLRCFQAAGSASVIALGAGTIIDIATSAERGGFLGLFSLGPMIGPCIGPVAGGLLANSLGWRAIFWFMALAAGVGLVFEFLFLPETLRTIVGDGSVPPPVYNRAIIPILGRRRKADPDDPISVPDKSVGKHNRLVLLAMFRNVDLILILFMTGIPYSVFYGIITTMPSLFLANYPFLNESDLGLCYIPYGAGAAIGSVLTGKFFDWDWRRYKRQAQERGEIEQGTKDGVYLEHARLRTTPVFWGAFIALVLIYGWAAYAKANLAVLLALQFLIGFVATGLTNINQVLLMDLFPGSGASITAANNFVRCICGAVLVSIVDYILNGVGTGWTFTILAGVTLVSYSMVIVEWKMGRTFRRRREVRTAREAEKRISTGH